MLPVAIPILAVGQLVHHCLIVSGSVVGVLKSIWRSGAFQEKSNYHCRNYIELYFQVGIFIRRF